VVRAELDALVGGAVAAEHDQDVEAGVVGRPHQFTGLLDGVGDQDVEPVHGGAQPLGDGVGDPGGRAVPRRRVDGERGVDSHYVMSSVLERPPDAVGVDGSSSIVLGV
jgi:hypothetical protein